MNAIKNKFRRSKRNSLKLDDQTAREALAAEEAHSSSSSTSVLSQSSLNSSNNEFVPVPPAMPPSDFWKSGSPTDYAGYFLEEHLYTSRTIEILSPQVIEKPAIIHEDIREEKVEEIQPIVQVEREKTEIHQIIQPLVDQEIKKVRFEERTLPMEVLPTIHQATMSIVEPTEQSSTVVEEPIRKVVERAPIVEEIEKWKIIEEIQPIIYRETIVPHIIRVSRPMREVIIAQPIMAETTLKRRDMYTWEREKYSRFLNMSVPRTDLAGKEILIRTNEGTTVLPVAGPMNRSNLVQETRTTTTVTEQVPVTNSLPMSSEEVILKKTHTEGMGLHGEKIVQDSVTTQSSSISPTKAI